MLNSEQTAWDNVKITATTKVKVSGTSQLDKVAKSQVATTAPLSAAQELENLANGNFKLTKGIFGGKSESGKIVDASKLTKLSGGSNSGSVASGVGSTSGDAGSTALVKMAKPVFSSGASDVGATIDIYGNTLNSPQNNIQSVLGDVLGIVNKGLSGILSKELSNVASSMNLVSAVTDSKSAEKILNQYRDSILSGVPLTEKGMKETLFKSIGYEGKSIDFLNGLADTKKGILADIVKTVDGQTGLLTLYNNTEMFLKGDYTTAQGIFKIVENVTSNTALGKFLDITNQMNILKAVTGTLYNLGVPELFEKIYDKLTDSSKVRYIKDNIAEALRAGDLEFLIFALKYKSGDWIRSNYPNALATLVESYNPKQELDGSIARSEYQRLITVMDQLDPLWPYSFKDETTTVYNLSVFAHFNNHVKTAFLAGGNRAFITNMMVAENYPEVMDCITEIKKRYPDYPIR